MNNYAIKSIKTLFALYTYENDYTDLHNANVAKQKIRNELYARVNEAFALLDKATTGDDVRRIYQRFIGR